MKLGTCSVKFLTVPSILAKTKAFRQTKQRDRGLTEIRSAPSRIEEVDR